MRSVVTSFVILWCTFVERRDIYYTVATTERHPLRFRFVREQRQHCLFRDGPETRRETRIVIEGNKVAERKLQAVTWSISHILILCRVSLIHESNNKSLYWETLFRLDLTSQTWSFQLYYIYIIILYVYVYTHIFILFCICAANIYLCHTYTSVFSLNIEY